MPSADDAVGVAGVERAAVVAPGEARAVRHLGVGASLSELRHELVDHVLALEVPDLDGRGGSSAEPVPVRGEGESVDDVLSRELIEALALVEVPEDGRAVLAAGRAQRAVGGHGHGVEVAVVAHKVALELEVCCGTREEVGSNQQTPTCHVREVAKHGWEQEEEG